MMKNKLVIHTEVTKHGNVQYLGRIDWTLFNTPLNQGRVKQETGCGKCAVAGHFVLAQDGSITIKSSLYEATMQHPSYYYFKRLLMKMMEKFVMAEYNQNSHRASLRMKIQTIVSEVLHMFPSHGKPSDIKVITFCIFSEND
jgi:hypothetical protein